MGSTTSRSGPAGALGGLVSAAAAAAPGPLRAVAGQIDAVRVLAEAGLIRPTRPDRLAAMLLAIARWGLTPAAGYVAAAARFGDEAAVIDDSGTVTFAELDRRSDAIAKGLLAQGVSAGDRVGLLCRNHRGFVEAAVAVSKLGADTLLLNTSFAAPQLGDVLRREHARLLIHDAEFDDVVREARVRRRRVVAWSEGSTGRVPTLDELATASSRRTLRPPAQAGRIVILTSGTSGTPKGASRGSPAGIDAAVALLSRIPLRARQRTLIAAPMFHAWGFAHLMLGTLLNSTLVLQRRFDAEAMLTAASQHRVQTIAAVPVMLGRIMELPDEVRRSRPQPALRVVAVSGSALPGDLAIRFMDEFGDVLYNLYGSTEVAWATIASPDELRRSPGTAGRAPRGTVIRILDDDGAEVARGRSGRIFVGNEMLFEGYTGGGDKERVDGLMSTGDIGHVDRNGLLAVEARDDEMIVSGGENVFPSEIENLLARHPAIADVAVIGVDDERFGQRLAAHVVLRGGQRLDADAVRSHVRSRLAGYKVPRDVVFVAHLPRNPAGKVVRRELDGGSEGGETAAAESNGAAAPRGARRGKSSASSPRRRTTPSGRASR